jgi:hypothetical protein
VAKKFKTPITLDELGSASSQAIAANVDGDSQNRINIDAGGKITWGSGSATGDTTLYRDSADTLKTDDAFTATSLAVTDQFTLPTSDGSTSQVLQTNGAGTISWVDITAYATVSDTAPGSPSVGQIWYESDTGKTFVYYDSFWIEVGASPPASPFITDLDEDTKIQVEESSDEDKIRFDTAGSERMIIDELGKVGIGTTSPAGNLHVLAGSSGVTNQNPAARLIIEDSDTAGIAINTTNTGNGYLRFVDPDSNSVGGLSYDHSTDLLAFRTSGSDEMVIASSGNVGIGTTTPAAQLEISNTGSGQLYSTGDGFYVDQSGSQLDSLFLRSQGPIQLSSNLDGGTSNDYIQFLTAAGQERVRITATGNVGIGTTTPAYKLDVAGDIHISNAAPYLIFTDTDTNAESRISASSGVGSLIIDADYNNEQAGTNIIFKSDGAEKMRIGSSGNVGIGTTSPDHMLHIVSGSGISNLRCVNDSGSEGFRVASTIVRSASINNITTGSAANVYIAGNNTMYRSTSSAKYKTDIETLEDDYADVVFRLRPVWYRSLSPDDPDEWSYYGLIAEEVAEVDPRLVHYGPSTDCQCEPDDDDHVEHVLSCLTEPEGVQYDRLVPHLISVVQRQSTTIQELTARIEALEAN